MASSKQFVGNPTPRVEGELKVSGQAKYAVDITVPGMVWGKLLRSPIASAKIKRIDTSKAEALPGVHAVITGQDCAGLKIGRRLYDMPILADGEVRFIGEKVAAVAADDELIAEEALNLIEVEYEETAALPRLSRFFPCLKQMSEIEITFFRLVQIIGTMHRVDFRVAIIAV